MKSSNNSTQNSLEAAAYGGDGWQQRSSTHKQEMGSIWENYGIDTEWRTLKTVLLHQPGQELNLSSDEQDKYLLLDTVDIKKIQEEHQKLVEAYKAVGVEVHTVDPQFEPAPNQMFCADLFVMTPQGAILGRPASMVRAGEERQVARRLAELGIPILKTLTGKAAFEGADLMWLDETTAMIGKGHRTNQQAIDQIRTVLTGIDCELIAVDMPYGTMHFMGMLRIPKRDLAICWPRRTPHTAVIALRERGYKVAFLPEQEDSAMSRAMNFVTLMSGKILMVEGLAKAQQFYESEGIECLTSSTNELSKAAGNIGCLTGVLRREMMS
ncbi:arginine deiminase family protein [Gammaproteobacteria bacterium]|nr:arginine deiminase family protein [Gammaproteobacteria bacterium]